jgi:hypothetical protein
MSTVNHCCLAAVLDVNLGDISHVTVCPALRFRVLRAVAEESGLPVGVQQTNKDSHEVLDSEDVIITIL